MNMRRGFTLIEMMVVVTVCLGLMTMVVPVFRLVTKTTVRIERKLAVYEAARMMLDYYETEINSAVYDTRGNQFGIKHGQFNDTDPFTPAVSATRYGASQRHCGELTYLRMPSFSSNTTMGSHYLNMCLYNYTWAAEVNLCAMGHNALSSDSSWPRTQFLADVTKGNTSGYLSQVHWAVTSAGHDTPAKATCPGFEWGSGDIADDEAGHGRSLPTLDVLDFEVAYWDDVEHTFKNLPNLTSAYFAPPPKAIRCTITVCDSDKRETLTLSRITRINGGTGSGVLASGSPDTTLLDPSPYNRLKNMKVLYPWRSY